MEMQQCIELHVTVTNIKTSGVPQKRFYGDVMSPATIKRI
jgi:hypothetical protein